MARMTMVRPVLVVLVLLALLLVAVWAGQRRLIYFPDRGAPSAHRSAEEVPLATTDGLTLAAWLVRPSGVDRRVAVLVAPGNAGNRSSRLPLATALAGAGLTVLLLEYRGYGGNPGSPSEAGLARDARAALTYLDGAGFPADRTVYFGESLGAAVAAELAVAHPPRGLLLRSPFVDLASVGGQHYPWLPVRLLLRDRYPVAEHVAVVGSPVTVVYGDADTIVPPQQSRTVAERAAGPTTIVVVDGADHNDAGLVHGPRVIEAVVDLAGR